MKGKSTSLWQERRPGKKEVLEKRKHEKVEMAENNIFIGGFHAVKTALSKASADCLEVWIRRDINSPAVEEIRALLSNLGLKAQSASASNLDKMYGDEELLDRCNTNTGTALILILDSIQDPRNFGACLRIADGAGVDGVIYPKDNSARLGSVLAKAASGAIDTVPLVPVSNLSSAIVKVQKAGIWVTGACSDDAPPLYSLDFSGPTAIVMGNEGSGLRRLTKERCDYLASIPMHGALGSLNVSAATSIVLFEVKRQQS
jgi:23S rRNA (guanosine2251-2'-O)-methyltransferase